MYRDVKLSTDQDEVVVSEEEDTIADTDEVVLSEESQEDVTE